MSVALRRFAVALVCVVLTGALAAQELAQKRMLEQKLDFVRQLIGDSPAVQRIAASENEVAKRHLDEGRRHYARAVDVLRSGDLPAAEKAANDAIWSIGRARQLVQDNSNRVIAERVRHQQLMSSAERLIPTYRAHLGHAGLNEDADLAAAIGLVEKAASLASAERIGDANRALIEAERHLLLGLTRLVGSKTLDYTPHFDSELKEYEYELERHASFRDLVPLAVAELNPGADARALIARYVERSQAMRGQAVTQAGHKQYATAVGVLKEATTYLQRALAAAGLTVPQQQ